MEIEIIEDKKNRLVFDIKGKSYDFCNMLKQELHNDKNVKIASYKVDHPLINIPRMLVETDGTSPKDALLSASQRIKKTADKFKKEVSKSV